jgi:hypothetical protein
MDPMGSGSVDFVTFAGWWNTGKDGHGRRAVISPV